MATSMFGNNFDCSHELREIEERMRRASSSAEYQHYRDMYRRVEQQQLCNFGVQSATQLNYMSDPRNYQSSGYERAENERRKAQKEKDEQESKAKEDLTKIIAYYYKR